MGSILAEYIFLKNVITDTLVAIRELKQNQPETVNEFIIMEHQLETQLQEMNSAYNELLYCLHQYHQN